MRAPARESYATTPPYRLHRAAELVDLVLIKPLAYCFSDILGQTSHLSYYGAERILDRVQPIMNLKQCSKLNLLNDAVDIRNIAACGQDHLARRRNGCNCDRIYKGIGWLRQNRD